MYSTKEENLRLILGLLIFGGVLIPIVLVSNFTEAQKIGRDFQE